MKQTNGTRLTPQDADKIMRELLAAGVPLEEIAKHLGVTVLYASRLPKPSYWRDGYIPLKTGQELCRLREQFSPDSYKSEIFQLADRLSEGDLYFIHSLMPIMEFHEREIRTAMLRCAARGVAVKYMFPKTSEIFEAFPGANLELAELVHSDLRYRYELLAHAFQADAASLDLDATQVFSRIEIREVMSPFLFSPWNKIVYIRKGAGKSVEHMVMQEHHSFDQHMKGFGSLYHWSCGGKMAERIGEVLVCAEHECLPWKRAARMGRR